MLISLGKCSSTRPAGGAASRFGAHAQACIPISTGIGDRGTSNVAQGPIPGPAPIEMGLQLGGALSGFAQACAFSRTGILWWRSIAAPAAQAQPLAWRNQVNRTGVSSATYEQIHTAGGSTWGADRPQESTWRGSRMLMPWGGSDPQAPTGTLVR